MLWILAFHIIAVISWFAGLFYLPRLYVYHAMTNDALGDERFKVMEHKLYYYIMTPAGIAATVLGIWLLSYDWYGYLHTNWMLLKLALVAVLWVHHLFCHLYLIKFKYNKNTHSHVFYRWFNEVPTIVLITVVILAIVKPAL